MKTNSKILLLSALALTFTACSNDEQQIDCFVDDPMANYGGPLEVCISLAGSNGQSTRTETSFSETDTEPIVGEYVFPRTSFSENDVIGIVHVISYGENSFAVSNYKAVTSDAGEHWTVQDVDGNNTTLTYKPSCENYYFAYSPYKEGGLTASDYDLGKLPECVVDTYDKTGQLVSSATVATPAYKFFEPLMNSTLTSYANQSTEDSFNAADVLGAKGECVVDMDNHTAVLTLKLDHLMALDVIALKKWDGYATAYGCYDTWVAPDNTIWRMKQRLLPTKKYIGDSRWPETEADASAEFEGMGNWYLGIDTDTCKFYYQLVAPDYMRAQYGPKKLAVNGGWIVDLPPVPSGYYSVQTPIYYTYFHQHGFHPANEVGNDAHDLWAGTEWVNLLGEDVPYTWTNEEILFDLEDYDYDEIMEIGDLLLDDGNIAKASEVNPSAVGTVRWIAYAPAPWLSTTAYDMFDRSNNIFYWAYMRNPLLFADNGYKAYGVEDVTANGVRYLTIDYAKHGCSSLDEFWRTDICNHYIAFNNVDVNYKSKSEDVKHDDPIFTIALPSISHNGEGLYTYKYTGDGWANNMRGTWPNTWVFMHDSWQDNASAQGGIRSLQKANDFSGPDVINGVKWKVPTAVEYYLGFFDTVGESDYITCSYLPGNEGRDNEGIISMQYGYGFDDNSNPYLEKPVYFGDGHIHIFYGFEQSYRTSFYSCHPLAGANYPPVEKDKIYIYNPNDGVQSVIAPPVVYKPCVAF